MNYTNPTHERPLSPQQLKTGDLVLFHGDGHVSSTIIELSGLSPWSHVTLVVGYEAQQYHSGQQQQHQQHKRQSTRPGIWEATMWHANQREVLHDELRGGARLVDLEERLAFTRPGTVGVRQLETTPHEYNDLQSRIQRFISAEDGKPYEPSLWPLIRSWFDILDTVSCMQPLFGRNKRDVSAYFCSELVAETLMQANVLRYEPGRPSDEFTVADFARLNEHDMIAPYRYGPLRPLIWTTPLQ
jgi:hypothetical protein